LDIKLKVVGEGDCTVTYAANGPYTSANCPDGYYAIFPNTGNDAFYVNVNTDATTGILVSIETDVATVVSEGTGYFKSPDGKYIERTSAAGNAISMVGTNIECSSSNVGKLVKDGDAVKLCLADNADDGKVYGLFQAEGETEKYILEKKEPFSSDETLTKSSIVVEANEDSILLSANYDASNGVFCDYSTHTLLTGVNNFCDGTVLNTKYVCDDGLCTQQDTGLTTATDYLVNIDGASKIYTCTIASDVASFSFKSNVNDVVAYKAVANDLTYLTPVSSGDLDGYTAAADLSGVVLYECVDGVCEVTDGYTKINDKATLAKYTSSTWTTPDEECSTKSTDAGNAKINSQELELCITGTSFGAINGGDKYFITKDDTSYNRYIVSADDYIIGFNNNRDGDYLIDTNAVVASDADGTHLVTCDGGDCSATAGNLAEAGYYIDANNSQKLINCNGTKCSLVASADAYYVDKDKKLINCDGTHDCETVATAAVGYYKGASSSYIKCTAANNCAVMQVADYSACEGNKQGQLSDAGLLCLDGSKTGTFGETKNYLVSYHDDNIFKSDSFNAATKFAVITIDAKSMTLADIDEPICAKEADLEVSLKGATDCAAEHSTYESCTDGICTAEPPAGCNPQDATTCVSDKYYLLTSEDATSVSDNTATGFLVKCGDSGKCGSVSDKGYYVNAYNEAYYTCNGTKGKCKKVNMGESCSTTGILYASSTDVYICLNGSKGIKLSDGGNHVLAYVEGNPLGTNASHYALVKLTATTVTINDSYSSGLGYVYVSTADLSVLTRGNCPAKEAGSYDTVVTELDCSTKYDCAPTSP